jgi:putative phosphoribosyl transferase
MPDHHVISSKRTEMAIHERLEMRERTGVFRDRTEAGRILAELLEGMDSPPDLVLAVTVGAVVTGGAVAVARHLPLDLALVARIPFPWNPEVGFGVAAFDGSTRLHAGLIGDMGLREPEIRRGERLALEKLEQRMRRVREGRAPLRLENRAVLLVDDGVASSLSMSTAIAAVKGAGARNVSIGVATAYEASLARLEPEVDGAYCPNIRGGWGFSVADAFERYGEVTDAEAGKILDRLHS